MTAYKMRVADRLDPNTHAAVIARNGQTSDPAPNGQIQENATAINVEREERVRRHSDSSSDSSSIHSYSSGTVQSVPDERPASVNSKSDEQRPKR
jgi:hypothetical protein